MMILDQIIATKKAELAAFKRDLPASQLMDLPFYSRKCISLKDNLLKENTTGIIAEFKQKSPSKGNINNQVTVEEVTRGYAEAGAAGLSVLTDFKYFGGSLENLLKAREANPDIPILRKDFMIDPYQIVEAKAFGADVILLIAACLSCNRAEELAEKAKDLGLEVLLEVHNAEEIEKVNRFVDIVGVNNRNLKSFEVDIETSVNLGPIIPDGFVKISESGISEPGTINKLRKMGYRGFLMGETFMKAADPARACREFIALL